MVLSVCGADWTGMRPSAAHRAGTARRSKSSGQPTGRAGKEAEEDSRADFSRCRGGLPGGGVWSVWPQCEKGMERHWP